MTYVRKLSVSKNDKTEIRKFQEDAKIKESFTDKAE